MCGRSPEENPALGWRAIRMLLDRRALLRLQLRALLTAADGRELSVMMPMVTVASELSAVRAIVANELAWVKGRRASASAP